jgi:fructose-1,6-bisphosphatase
MISSVAIEIYNSLNDKRNCISKYTRIKKAVAKEFVHILQCEISADPNSNNEHL